ncbi:MAG: hypothetical protein SNJ63_03680 [Sphingomonadaceae bacterium]
MKAILAPAVLLGLAACTTGPATETARPPEPAAPPALALSPIHRDLSPLETVWHVRAGLNVAALGCQALEGPGIVADYNAFLKRDAGVLKSAYDATVARYQGQGGAWQKALDTDMTRLYNHFSSPPVHVAYCDAAVAVLREALATPEDQLVAWAPGALAALDRPFTAPPQLAAARGGAVSGFGGGMGRAGGPPVPLVRGEQLAACAAAAARGRPCPI